MGYVLYNIHSDVISELYSTGNYEPNMLEILTNS